MASPEPIHNPRCFANHLGPWAVEPKWFQEAVSVVRAGLWKIRSGTPLVVDNMDKANHGDLYRTTDGIAVISMSGPIMKGMSKFDDTCSSILTRIALREASKDSKVNAIMLVIDSPGGTVAGTQALAEDVKNIDTNSKPVMAHADDLCASAAYWVASQSRRLTANGTSQIGSIGTVAVIEDTSKNKELQGIKVHVISTGDYKGAFTDGTPVTKEQIDYVQGLVNSLNDHFLSAVVTGRQMPMKDVKKCADGRCFVGAEAKSLGLIDQVCSLDEAIQGATEKYGTKAKAARSGARAQEADLMLRAAEQRSIISRGSMAAGEDEGWAKFKPTNL